MIMNLFTKAFLVIEGSLQKNEKTNIKAIDDCIKSTFKETFVTVFNEANNMEKSSFKFLTVKTIEDYEKIIRSYFGYLHIKNPVEVITKISEHNSMFWRVWEMCGIAYTPNIVITTYLQDRFEKEPIEFFDVNDNDYGFIELNSRIENSIPAEYMINDFINMKSNISTSKFLSFLKYDLGYGLLKELLRAKNDGSLKEIHNRWDEIFKESSPPVKFNIYSILYELLDDPVDDNLYEELIKLLKEKVFIGNKDIDIIFITILDNIEMDTKEKREKYLDLNTTMGYSAMGLFKYNKLLANYIRNETEYSFINRKSE